jgi:mRNA interferase MazF
MEQYFNQWHKVKKRINKTRQLPTFKEREIWWCSIGQNIGFEIYGKGEQFWRPVLILDKHNEFTFLGLPLTSKQKDNRYCFPLDFQNEKVTVLLGQARTFSSKRLSNKMGTLPDPIFDEIKQTYGKLFLK